MKLERLDYWLLDRVVEHVCPMVAVVGSPEHMVALFNCEAHGASNDEVAEAFVRLFKAGLIEAGRPDAPERVRLGRVEIAEALADAGPYCELTSYGLTSLGGSAWEEAAKPDWSRFVQAYGHFDPDEDDEKPMAWVVRAASREQAERHFEYLCDSQLRAVGDVDRSALRPWQATYWKELPEGFELRFRAHPDTNHPERIRGEPPWYTRPW